jgi:predicted site-specific integrase-resolvase
VRQNDEGKLTEWAAREQGVSYRSAVNWFLAGTVPVPARQLSTDVRVHAGAI